MLKRTIKVKTNNKNLYVMIRLGFKNIKVGKSLKRFTKTFEEESKLVKNI